MSTWKKDILSSAFFLAVMGFFFYGGTLLKETAWKYPRMLVISCAVCTVILLIRGIRGRTKEDSAAAAAEDAQTTTERKAMAKQSAIYIGVCCLSMFGYIFLIELIGYLLSTILFILALLLFMSVRKWWVLLLVSVGVSGFLYLMFNNLLMVLLPTGSLFL